MLWPTLISMAAVIVLGVPFTYFWFRWSDRWADSEKKRFKESNADGESLNVRVIRTEPADKGDR